MAGGEHDTRRIHCAAHYPAPEAGGGGRYRRIPAEQDRDVGMIRILTSKDVNRVLARRSARLADAEAVVRPILDAVRRYGDKALLEYARKFEKRFVAVPADGVQNRPHYGFRIGEPRGPPRQHAVHVFRSQYPDHTYITILFSGYSTIPSAPACFRRGIMSRTVDSSSIVFTASHSPSLR